MNRYVMSVAVLAVTGSVCAQAVQWPEAEGGNGHWYEAVYVGPNLSWSMANSLTIQSGGYLATPVTSEEDNWIISTLLSDDTHWGYNNNYAYGPHIGGWQNFDSPDYSEPGGGWEWITEETFDYSNWLGLDNCCGGQDRMQYFKLNGDIGWIDVALLNDQDPLFTSYIIEWSADCNGDGIVDYGQIRDGTYADNDGNGVPDCCDNATCLAPVQWRTEDGGNGNWYKAIAPMDPQCWESNRAEAESLGGHLATITSSEEQTLIAVYVSPLYPTLGGSAIGGIQQPENGPWTWITGEAWTYDNFQAGENNTNEDYLDFNPGNSLWRDRLDCVTGSSNNFMLVEWSADCNDDGIVDYGQIRDGSLEDLNENGVPDCCELPGGCEDCNDNGVLDSEDLANGTSQDCNTNGVPDECDIADGTSSDCNTNSIPDECESLADCDGDGTSDACDILGGALDVNPADGVPDECQGLPLGACCINGACMMGTAANCFAAEGSYAGDGVSCIDANCPPACLGDLVPDGVVDISDVLVILSEFGSVCP